MEEGDRQLLKENRMDIARDLDVDTATSYLYSKSIFTENHRDEILALKTRQSKSEKLLDILPQRGPEAFGWFVKFLDEKQPYLSSLLKPQVGSMQESKQPVDNVDSPAPSSSDMKPVGRSFEEKKPSSSQDLAEGSQESAKECSGESEGVHCQPKEDGQDQGDGGRISCLNLNPSTCKDGLTCGLIPDYVYPMSSDPRGEAFIINNKTFQQMDPREGTDVDAETLKDLFQNTLKFKTRVYHNQTSKEIYDLFDKYAAMDHSNYDCIICAILTHGEEGLIYSTDGKIEIKELTSKFRSKNLLGIPKLFFFQACQGSDYMDGFEQTDGPVNEEALDEVDAPPDHKIAVPIEADFLYAYSTAPGYYSFRNNKYGSWFVQAIVDVFQKNAKTLDVLRMMTRVNAKVAKQKSNTNRSSSHNKMQIPSIISQLRKDLYFFPEDVFADRLANIRKSKHGVLTKENLGLNFKPEKLDMFHEDIQCDESLGNILLKNWNSDEQVPNESKSIGQPLEKECVSAAELDSFARKSPVASTNIGRTASTSQTSANVANTSSPATYSSQRPKKEKIRRVPGF